MKLKVFLVLASVGLLFSSSCNPDNWASTSWYIDIQNNSSETILVTTGCKKENGKILLTTEFPEQEDLSLKRVLPRQERRYTKPYKEMVLDPNAMLAIFIISPEVYENYSWEEIGEKELFLKKYVFRYGDMPFTPIIYPNDYD